MGQETKSEATSDFSPSMIEELAGNSLGSAKESQEIDEVDEAEETGEEEGYESDEDEDDLGDDDEDAEDESDEDEDESDEEEENLGKSQTRLLKEMTKEILALRRELKAQKTEKVETKPVSEPDKPIDFVDDSQFNGAMESKDEFNRVLNTVYQAGQTAMLSQLPSLIEKAALKQVREYMLIQDFYKSNPDLRKVGPLVQTVAEEIVMESKGKKIDTQKLLTETAKRTRERMGKESKPKKVVDARAQSRNPGSVTPMGARPGNGRPGKKHKTTIGDELAGLADVF